MKKMNMKIYLSIFYRKVFKKKRVKLLKFFEVVEKKQVFYGFFLFGIGNIRRAKRIIP